MRTIYYKMAKNNKLPKTTEELREIAVSNIENDRRETEELLLDLKAKMVQNQQHHQHNQVAGDMVKYLETLLKANAQLVKIVEIESRRKMGEKPENPVENFNPEDFYDNLDKEMN